MDNNNLRQILILVVVIIAAVYLYRVYQERSAGDYKMTRTEKVKVKDGIPERTVKTKTVSSSNE